MWVPLITGIFKMGRTPIAVQDDQGHPLKNKPETEQNKKCKNAKSYLLELKNQIKTKIPALWEGLRS